MHKMNLCLDKRIPERKIDFSKYISPISCNTETCACVYVPERKEYHDVSLIITLEDNISTARETKEQGG